MNASRRHAVAALTGAGLLWGSTVPLSRLALEWLGPGWLTVARFGLAAPVLLAVARPRLRPAFTPMVLASGAVGYGGSVIAQNAGLARTSVTHGALLLGAVPVLVAVIAVLWHRAVARPVAWAGFAVSLAGVALVTVGGGGGGATLGGDGLVLVSELLTAMLTVAQARLLPGRDPIAVTAVQVLGAALGALAYTVITEGGPGAAGWPRAGPGRRRTGGGRHAAALRAVHLRANPGARRDRRGVLQPGARGRRRRRSRDLRRPDRPRAGHRRRGHPRGHRAEQPPADRGQPGQVAAGASRTGQAVVTRCMAAHVPPQPGNARPVAGARPDCGRLRRGRLKWPPAAGIMRGHGSWRSGVGETAVGGIHISGPTSIAERHRSRS